VTRDQIVVTAGGVEALYTSMSAILDPGDEILLPDPGWPNFAMGAAMMRANPVLYPLHEDRGFIAQIDDLTRLLTPKTKALLINSPSNPIGSVIGRAQMTALVAFAEKHDLWLISDECYDETTFDDTFVSAAAIGGTERIISCYTFSKTYAMTGWRIGYAVLPLAVAAQVAKLQEPVTSCVNHPAQFAALAALTGPQDAVIEMRDEYKRRRDICLATLRAARLDVSTPSGAFYLWVKLGDVGCSAVEFARAMVRGCARYGVRSERGRFRAYLTCDRTRVARRGHETDDCRDRAAAHGPSVASTRRARAFRDRRVPRLDTRAKA
jgi:aspartate aminotransferase